MDDTAVIKATGKQLSEWFAILDERGARELQHKEIARLLHQDFGVPGWWSQSVTVEYEKHIGRRETGQTQSGEYDATVSKTLPGTMDEVLDRWMARVAAGPGCGFDGVDFAGEPSASRTEKWRYWRVALADGSRVTVTISDKPGGTTPAAGPASVLAVTSGRLRTRDDGARWKSYWRAYLAEL